MKAAIQLIREVDRGQLLDDFQNGLDEIVSAIEMHGGTGEITIKLKVTRKSDAYEIGGKLDIKVPQAPRLGMLMFFDADQGELTRNDPRQPVMPSIVKADFDNKKQENS